MENKPSLSVAKCTQKKLRWSKKNLFPYKHEIQEQTSKMLFLYHIIINTFSAYAYIINLYAVYLLNKQFHVDYIF